MRRRGKLRQSSLFKGRDASLLVVGRHRGQNGGQPCQHVTRVAKLSELGAARCSRREESLPWGRGPSLSLRNRTLSSRLCRPAARRDGLPSRSCWPCWSPF